MSKCEKPQFTRAVIISMRAFHILYAGLCIACSAVILHYDEFQHPSLPRAISGLAAAITAMVFGAMMARRRLIWVAISIIMDIIMILINVITTKLAQPQTLSNWMSAVLIGIGLLHYCLGLMELFYITRRQNEDKEISKNTNDSQLVEQNLTLS